MKKNKSMSPLIIVGMLISTALADVSHVLSGSAHPPPNPSDVNSLVAHKSAFQSGNPQDFWWMASNSPLKASYDYYKKCSSKGNCLPPINVVSDGTQITKSANSADANLGPIDVQKNPFLNGDYQSGSAASSSSFSSSGCNACSSGSKSNGVAAFHSGTKIDITNNPFLNGQVATAGNGDTIKSDNGFLGVQPKKPGFATSHPLSNKKPFATSPPFGQQSFVLGGDSNKVECKGNGYICTAKNLCVNGVVNKNGEGLFQVRSDVQYCDANTEVCCRLANGSERPPFDIILPTVSGKSNFASNINDLVDISAGKSSVTGSTFKFSGGAGSSPGQVQVLTDQSIDVKPQVYHIGESGSHSSSNASKPSKDITPSANSVFPTTVDYSNVQFANDVRFASTIRGPAYLPPIGGPTPPSKTPDLEVPTVPVIVTYQPSIPTSPRPIQTTPRLCPSGTYPTPFGSCEPLRTPPPICPFGTIQGPDSNCVVPNPPPTPPSCPPGKFLTASGICESPKPPTCPFGTILKADGSCERPISTPKPCPPGTFPTTFGSCEAPSTPSQSCPYGTIRSPNGVCEKIKIPSTPRPCLPGTFLTPSGLCEAPKPPPCPFGTIQKADGSCERPTPTPRPCPPGTFLTASGSCESPSTPAPSCPYGTIQSPNGICERPRIPTTPKPCLPGTFLTPSGLCEAPKPPPCPFGTIKKADGSCERPIPTPRPCPPGTFLTASGLCETPNTPPPTCPFGTVPRPDGSCERPRPSCALGTYLSDDGNCIRLEISTTPQPCPPGTFLTASGQCESPRIPTPRPSCPPGAFQVASGACEYPTASSTTIGYEYSKPCPPGTFKSPAGLCERPIVTTPRPQCPFGTYLTPSGSCETTSRPSTPKPPPRPFETTASREYLPPVTPTQYVPSITQKPHLPSITPEKPFQPSATPQIPQVTSPRPFQSSATSDKPFQTSITPRIPSITTQKPYYPSITTPRPYKPSEITQRPYQSSTRPNPFFTTPTAFSPAIQCKNGLISGPNGSCILPTTTRTITCSFGQKLSNSGKCEQAVSTQGYNYPNPTTLKPTPFCGPNQILSPSGSCTYQSQSTPRPITTFKPSCEPGKVPSPSGFGCIYPPSPNTPNIPVTCLPGQKLSSTGICQYPSTKQGYEYPKPTTTKPSRFCGPDQTLTPSGSCIYSTQPSKPTLSPVSCEFGQVLSQSGSCIYPTQSTPRPQPFPKPSCGPGQVPSLSGFGCVYPSSPSTPSEIRCSAGQKLSTSGVCEYPTPTHGYEYPKPTTPKPSISCRPGQILTSSGTCVYSSQTTSKPTLKPSCGFGQVLSSSGSCIFPSQSTQRPQPKPSCGGGKIPSSSGFGCVYPPSSSSTSRPTCSPGQELSPSGICEYPTPTQGYEYPKPTTKRPSISCRPGQILSSSGSCVDSPQPPSKPTPSPEPSCRFGQVLSSSGSCISPSQSTPKPQTNPFCGAGQIPSPSGFGCVYPPSSSSTSRPTCSPGQELSASGVCQYPTPTQGYEYPKPTTRRPSISCGPDQILSSSGSCIYTSQPTLKPTSSPEPLCRFGQVLSSSGSCIFPSQSTPKPQPKPSCGAGQIPSPSGFGCVYPSFSSSTSRPTCSPGQELSASGVCQYPTPTQGYEYPNPTTRRPSVSCGPGQILSSSGSCVYSSQPPSKPTPSPEPSCRFGQVLSSSGSCVFPSQSTPKPQVKPNCGVGQIPSPSGFGCVYHPSSSSTPRPTCLPGQEVSSSGLCKYPTPTEGYEYPKPTTQKPSISCRPGQILTLSGSCVYPSPPPSKPTTPTSEGSCGFGQVLSPSGSCIYPSQSTSRPKPSCKSGQIPSSSGFGCIYPPSSTPTCLPGQKLSASGVCQYPSPTEGTSTTIKPSLTCRPGQIPSPSGFQCIYPYSPNTPRPILCQPGQVLSASGICQNSSPTQGYDYPKPSTPFCSPGQTLSPSGSCIYSSLPTTKPAPSSRPPCAFGQIPSFSGVGCEYPKTPKPTLPSLVTKPSVSCPFGSKLSPITNDCITGSSKPTVSYEYPKPTSTLPQITSKTCKFGQILTPSGICIYPSQPTLQPQPSCGIGQILSSSGICTYPTAIESTVTQQPKSCPPGQIVAPSGYGCIFSGSTESPKQSCRPGQVLSSSGLNCEYPTTPKPLFPSVTKPSISCPFGAKLSPITNECITSSPTTGYKYPKPSTPFEPSASTIRPPTAKQCYPGQVLSSRGVCIYASKTTPNPQPYPTSPCGPGQELSKSGSCIFSSRPTPKPFPSPKPSCRVGQELAPSGICIYPSQSTPGLRPSEKPICGPGQVLSSSGFCSYSSQTTLNPVPSPTTGYEYSKPSTPFIPYYTGSSTLRPTCPRGQVLSISGVCIYPSETTSISVANTTPSCGRGQVLSDLGYCINLPVSTPGPIPSKTTGYVHPTPSPSFTPTYTGSSTVRPTTAKQCAPGQILSSSGVCIYSPRPTSGPQPSSPFSCRPGQILSSSGTCIYSSQPTSTPKPSCGPGQILSLSGTCTYASQTPVPTSSRIPGYEYPKPSTPFEPSYPRPSTITPTTINQCAPGQILSSSGSCIYPLTSTPGPEAGSSPSCRQGQILSQSGICIYPSRPTTRPFPSPKPSCASGQVLSSTGICIYPSPTPRPHPSIKPSCGIGQTISPTGSCIYPSHSTQSPFPSSRPYCRPGQELSPSGVCIYTSQSTTIPQPTSSSPCKPGQILSASGSCIYVLQPSPKPSCAVGQVLSQSGSCIYPSQSTISLPGTTLNPTSKQCPPGSKPSAFGSGCEYPRPTTPKPTSGTFTGYDYPKPSTPFEPKPQCPFGTRPGPSGACERPSFSTTTPRYDVSPTTPTTSRQCPPDSQLRPSGICEGLSTPSPRPSVTSITPRYDYPKNCPPGTVKTASGKCEPPYSFGTTPQCPPGTNPGPTGSCEPFPQPTPRPQCPFGTRLGPNGSCESSKLCPPGTYKTPSGDCKNTETSQSTPGYEYPKPCPPGTIKTSSGECTTFQKPSCPPGSSLSPSGKCQYPSPTPSIPGQPTTDTNNQFTPSYPTKKPYRPTTTPRPADGYIYNKPTPTFGYPSSTLIPNSNSINQVYVPSPTTYLPPDESTEAGSNSEVRIPHRTTTERPADVTGESVNSVSRVVYPSTRRPPIYNGEQNEAPPAGCAAALKCVQEIYCTADGFVSPVPVVLTKDQELLKVPTTVCKDEDSGIIGKCCRDPNYKDPWPSANLVNGVDDGQYKEDNLYGQRGVANNRLARASNRTRSSSRPVRNSNSPRNNQGSQPKCGERNHNTNPVGPGPIDANFAEYPWQAMILRDSNRSLLCGGAIIRRNAVLTTAHCVEGLDTSDVLIKGGEWKLGIDEEPLPFQIVKVAAILRHPGYKAGSYENDLAILVLQEKLRPSKNVGTICLPQPNQIPTTNCVATGWGKRILQLHAKGALMHHIKVNVMDSQQCQQTLQQHFQDSVQNYNPNTLCGFSDIDQCKVDYGSALACSDDQGHYTLSGTYAWDTGCKQEGQIGGYIAPDVEWIDLTLAKSLKDLKKLEKEYLLKSRV